MKLTATQKLQNGLFAVRMHEQLKEGGVWAGDEFSFKKVGQKFYALDEKSWEYAKQTFDSLMLMVGFDIANPIYKPSA